MSKYHWNQNNHINIVRKNAIFLFSVSGVQMADVGTEMPEKTALGGNGDYEIWLHQKFLQSLVSATHPKIIPLAFVFLNDSYSLS